MAILVTGGAGYIGSVTVERLRAAGEEVVVLDDLVRGHREALDRDVLIYQGNVGDLELISRIAREHRLESCIHFAARAYVGESVADPAAYFENNVARGVEFIGGLIRQGILRLVFSSTCATYGEPDQFPIQEQCPQWPTNPYGWSKLFLERVLDSYDKAYGLKFVALRYFNAAGATERCGEHHEPEPHLIPNVLSAALGERPDVSIYGSSYPTRDGTAIRDYIHVSDLADAHIRALGYIRRGGKSDFINLGTGRGFSALEVVECARQVTGKRIITRMDSPRLGDPARLIADAAKARATLGWEPVRSDLPSILHSAWQWRLRNPQGYANEQ